MFRSLLTTAIETVPALLVRQTPTQLPPPAFALAAVSPASSSASPTKSLLSSLFPSLFPEQEEAVKQESLEELMKDPFALMAVPKRKPSHSKKRMRMNHKYLQVQHHVGTCKTCGNPKLLHHLCLHCVTNIRELWRKKTAASAPTTQQ